MLIVPIKFKLMVAHPSCLPPGFFTHIDGKSRSPPSVIVIGGGISGIAAARALSNASFKVNFLFKFHNQLMGLMLT